MFFLNNYLIIKYISGTT